MFKLTGAILAGGASRRMGGLDKGLIDFQGRPLIAWVIEALAPQVDEIVIVANRNLDSYRSFGHRVVSDLRPDFAGPLAGLEAALNAARHDWVLSCPTDAPRLPANYAERMLAGLPASAAAAFSEDYWQPVYSLLPRAALPALSAALDAGERKPARWLESLAPRQVLFAAGELRDADTPEDLQALS